MHIILRALSTGILSAVGILIILLIIYWFKQRKKFSRECEPCEAIDINNEYRELIKELKI